jgi:hypothetical protein
MYSNYVSRFSYKKRAVINTVIFLIFLFRLWPGSARRWAGAWWDAGPVLQQPCQLTTPAQQRAQ